MNLDNILKEWDNDSRIDPLRVGNHSIETAKLHSKYIRYLSDERIRLKGLKNDYNTLIKLKTEYYKGSLDEQEMKARGWKPNPLRILNTDIPIYIQADKDIVDLSLKIGIQEEKVSTLIDILKTLGHRNYDIKNYIEWQKFTNGV
jgi:Recombination, repair and ssDNA binding protein UvsY